MTHTDPPPTAAVLGSSALREDCSGVLVLGAHGSVDGQGRLMHAEDPAAQLALALSGVEASVRAAGLVPADIAQLRVSATDLPDVLAVLSTLTDRLAEVGATPALSVVGVAALPVDGMLVALDGLAVRTHHASAHHPHLTRSHLVPPPSQKERIMTVESTLDPIPTSRAEVLRDLCGGAIHLAGDPGYDAARMPWNIAVDLRPAAVAVPRHAHDVVDVVRAAAAAGLRVAAQGTGHGAGPLGAQQLDDVVLLRTHDMSTVSIDPDARTARVEGGALWQDVVEAAAPHGLAALHGSAPDVAVIGYSLGGGLSWFARALGLAAHSVTAVEVVTADGSFVRADADHHADLFWALRGGGGSFGVVTAIEFDLYPLPDAYAGMLLWDRERAPEVVRAWAQWSRLAPDEITTSLRVVNFPPLPELPPFLSGRQLVVIDGVALAEDDSAAQWLAPLRALGPEMDTFARVPSAALLRLHMDPEGPTPSVASSTVLVDLPESAIEAFLDQVGPGSTSSLLSAELRQLGGALARPSARAGALAQLEGAYAGFFVAIAATPEMAQQGRADGAALVAALSPWATGTSVLNFTEEQTDARTAYAPGDWERLRAIRDAVDPDEVFAANHPVPGRDRGRSAG